MRQAVAFAAAFALVVSGLGLFTASGDAYGGGTAHHGFLQVPEEQKRLSGAKSVQLGELECVACSPTDSGAELAA